MSVNIVDLSSGQRKRYLGQLKVLARTPVAGSFGAQYPRNPVLDYERRRMRTTWAHPITPTRMDRRDAVGDRVDRAWHRDHDLFSGVNAIVDPLQVRPAVGEGYRELQPTLRMHVQEPARHQL